MSLFTCRYNTSDTTALYPGLATPPPPLTLPVSLLVWPAEGDSYSLVITERMMCALKCALPA